METHDNCIGGDHRPAHSGAVFEVQAAPRSHRSGDGAGHPGGDRAGPEANTRSTEDLRPRTLGSWPRSGVADVHAAILAAASARGRWTLLGLEGRRGILERASRELAGDPDPRGLVGARLGVEPRELAPHLLAIPESLDRALRDPIATFGSRRIAEEGLFLFAPAWSDLVAPTAAALFSALLLGRTVLLVSDPGVPMLAEAIVAALERAGLPEGVLSLVHDDGDDALRSAFASGAASYTRASGYPTRVRRLERLAAQSLSSSSGAGFGAGVQPALAPAVDFRVLRAASTFVRSDEDPAARAAQVMDAAFGRSTTLSGQLPVQAGRALCHERSFSRFAEALLACLRKSPDVASPVPLVERESEVHLRRVRVLGLDEGATLIFDGDDTHPRPAAAPGAGTEEAADRSPVETLEASLSPTVFTNVEERMRLAHLGRPAPLLCLLRVQSDEQGEALAERLDRGVPAENVAWEADSDL